MKNKELIRELSRLQSKAYSLQNSIERLVSALSRELEIQKKLEQTGAEHNHD